MIDIINDTKPKANKNHKCNYCGGVIQKGELYHAIVLKYDNIYQWKSHLRCDKIVSKLDMYDQCYEGVTQDVFYEYISEAYYKLLGENTAPAKRSFQERLDIVCNHYQII